MSKNENNNQRILVVDDSVTVRKMTVHVLSRLNFEVETASNGKEALDLMIRGSYAAVLMDFTMPVF